MNTYRLKIKPLSNFATPWHADTIFGSLCWLIVWREGVDALGPFLQQYLDGDPPFILSDGFPTDFMPAPAHLPLIFNDAETYDKYGEYKHLKGLAFLNTHDFQEIRQGHNCLPGKSNFKPFQPVTTLHNTISRITGTTGEEGSLYEIEEWTMNKEELRDDLLSIYLRIKDGWEDKAFNLFKELSHVGYGKKKSIGKGSFEIVGELERFAGFDDFNDSNGFIMLNNFAPAASDPIDGYYKTTVKYGKLGGEYTFCGNPFKKPLVMISAGSVFKTDDEIKDYYGRMVPNISPALKNVVHYGYGFAVPCRITVA